MSMFGMSVGNFKIQRAVGLSLTESMSGERTMTVSRKSRMDNFISRHTTPPFAAACVSGEPGCCGGCKATELFRPSRRPQEVKLLSARSQSRMRTPISRFTQYGTMSTCKLRIMWLAETHFAFRLKAFFPSQRLLMCKKRRLRTTGNSPSVKWSTWKCCTEASNSESPPCSFINLTSTPRTLAASTSMLRWTQATERTGTPSLNFRPPLPRWLSPSKRAAEWLHCRRVKCCTPSMPSRCRMSMAFTSSTFCRCWAAILSCCDLSSGACSTEHPPIVSTRQLSCKIARTKSRS
mmetsp:Transcript_68044/g.221520  ORF Transcript_68044/g.221520 Transcript_68044/m.221520 type:complete len:292 (-) Transcript_68044:6342-7217(-)